MSKNRKRLLLTAKILYEETDTDNAITVPELMECLEAYGIKPDRKPVYLDIKAISETLFPVKHIPGKGYYAVKKGDHHADGK